MLATGTLQCGHNLYWTTFCCAEESCGWSLGRTLARGPTMCDLQLTLKGFVWSILMHTLCLCKGHQKTSKRRLGRSTTHSQVCGRWYKSRPGTLQLQLVIGFNEAHYEYLHKHVGIHLVQTLDRKGIGDYHIDLRLGQKVFIQQQQDEDQQLLKLNVVGEYQTEKRKATCDDSIDGCCPICDMEDTREHRFLKCPQFQLRVRYKIPSDILREERMEWMYYDVFTYPYIDNTNIHARWGHTVGGARSRYQMIIERFLQTGSWLTILFSPCSGFAHGSCLWTTDSGTEAIVCYLICSKLVHRQQGRLLVEFVTDASYVCKVIQFIVNRSFMPFLHKMPNADLILELAELWRPEEFTVTKVK